MKSYNKYINSIVFPPSIFGLFAATFCNTCVGQLRSWFIFNPFLIITNTFSLY